MTFKQMKRCKVGLAFYKFDWHHFTGTQTLALELARSMPKLEQSAIEYKVLLREDILPEQFGLSPAVCLNVPPADYRLSQTIKRKLKNASHRGADAIRGIFGLSPNLGYLGISQTKDWLCSLDLDLLYYPSMWQWELVLSVPIVAQLFDMQHVHYPELWEFDGFQRQKVFNWYGKHARLITCNFDFVATDIKENLNVAQEKISPIFLAPPSRPKIDYAYARSVKEKFGLPEHYFIYPASTWPHKNHINLVRALGECVASGLEIFCVCPGENSDWLYPGQFAKIQEEAKKYKVEKNMYFLGNIPHIESCALTYQADFVCVPSLYEAGCYPIWEASVFAKAVACSETTMIPYQIRDAGLLFDPHDPSDIAAAIRLLHKDLKLRDALGKKARELIDQPYYSPEKTSLGYHRAFVNTLVRLGKLSRDFWIEDDPAPPLDRGPKPPKFEWRSLLK